MSEETPKIVNPVSYNSTGIVYLTPSLANSMTSANHVIVTKADLDTPSVKWSDVDKDNFLKPYSNKRIPSSKIVGEIADIANSINNELPYLSSSISSISSNVSSLQQDIQLLTSNTDIENIQKDLAELSSNLSGLFCLHAVRFIGVSETDPLCGIVTIDGIKYVVSSDFNESNNGDIVYYKTTLSNHLQTDGSYDLHEPEKAITVMYAYIYANGIWNDSGSAQVNDDVIDDDNVGSFHKFGYSFYNNLSTLIHDDMVCDFANIKITKISGLQDKIILNNTDHEYLSSRISSLNNDLSVYLLKADSEASAISFDLSIANTKTQIDTLSNKLSNYLSTGVRVNSLNYSNDRDIPTTSAVNVALSEINNSILTTRTDLTSRIKLSADDLLKKLQLSVDNILNILSATLRPEPNSVNKRNLIINNYTW